MVVPIEARKAFAQNVTNLLSSTGKTQRDLAEAVGVSAPTVSEWLKCKKYPRMDKIQKIADYFGVKKSQIIELKPKTNVEETKNKIDANVTFVELGETVRIPVYGRIPAGVPREAIEDITGYIDVDKQMAEKHNLLALQVIGDSMYPTYLEGDYVLIKEQPDCESGQVCAVRINDNDVTLKKVIKEVDGLMLQPINPEYPPRKYDYNDEFNPVKIIGVVIELRRKV